jgi:cytoskeleton protein RodZ
MSQDETEREAAAAREEAQDLTGESLGRYLRRHRLQQHLELEEIAAHIRVQPATLKAIEEDNKAVLPAEVFTRGFIKSYARHLGLDADEALSRHIRQTTEGGKAREEKINVHEVLASEELAEAPQYRWGRYFLIALLLAALALLAYLAMDPVEQGTPQIGGPPRQESPLPAPLPAPPPLPLGAEEESADFPAVPEAPETAPEGKERQEPR